MASPIVVGAEEESLQLGGFIDRELLIAMQHASRIHTDTPLTSTHNAVLHFHYDPSQPTVRRRFIFQSGKMLPRGDIKAHIEKIVGFWPPQLETQLLRSDLMKKFKFSDTELASAVLLLFTPLTPSRSSKGGGLASLITDVGFYRLQPMHLEKRSAGTPARPLVEDWESLLRVTLSGEQPDDQDTVQEIWMLESGNARLWMDRSRLAYGESAYQNEARILGPLIHKKDESSRFVRSRVSDSDASSPHRSQGEGDQVEGSLGEDFGAEQGRVRWVRFHASPTPRDEANSVLYPLSSDLKLCTHFFGTSSPSVCHHELQVFNLSGPKTLSYDLLLHLDCWLSMFSCSPHSLLFLSLILFRLAEFRLNRLLLRS
jgi:hypothetical protein